MKERPILFSGPMVRAILDGSKTQTRRIVKLDISGRVMIGGRNWHLDDTNAIKACPYGLPGDRLWVRETWQAWRKTSHEYDEWEVCGGQPSQMLDLYGQPSLEFHATSQSSGPWRPSIHMPRWASRIDLLIESVCIERLQDISDADSLAEGVDRTNTSIAGYARQRYLTLWEQINGTGSWEANPWVWVIRFERIKP